MIVRVATEISADRLFDYAVPERLRAQIRVGQCVRVPFGGRAADAYVIEIVDVAVAVEESSKVLKFESSKVDMPCTAGTPCATDLFTLDATPPPRLKSVTAILSDTPYLSPALITLTRWMADYYCAPFEQTLRCALPATIRNRDMRAKEQLYVTLKDAPSGELKLTPHQTELLENLRRVGGGWLQAMLCEFACTTGTLRKLEAAGAIAIESRQMRRDPLANRRILPTQPMRLMPEQAAALEAVVGLIEVAHGVPAVQAQTGMSAPPCETVGAALVAARAGTSPAPTAAPCTAGTPCATMTAREDARPPLLLHGVTGSGKTEVYLQAIGHVLEQGRGAIVLVPEIALTPQTVQRFAARFGPRVAVLHSALSDGERFDEWHRIRSGEAQVVVGPRSAIFAPVANLGIIIVDEEHEPSYKQDESPRYHARDVAVMRGHFERCAVVLGTATPSMETWLNVQKGKYRVAHLTARVANRPMPHVQVVDMRLDASGAGHVRMFSGELLDALKLRLERGEQSILFLNRRGYSSAPTCPSCGAAVTCGNCSVSYTYHRADDCLRCHVCGGWRRVPDKCPECGDPAFKYIGFGTQRIEQALQRCFPKARVLRMDTDVTTRKHSHDEILGRFKSGHADILIGTQMIAKGLDFPNVTLVGVLSADMSLRIPDFRAGERTYQLLAQVSGRAGRDELPGEVFIQTFSPQHPAVKAAVNGDFEAFAAQELTERQHGGYPPYTHLVCLGLKGVSEERVKYAATLFARELAEMAAGGAPQGGADTPVCAHSGRQECLPHLFIVSDAYPAPLAKAKGLYRYQVTLRAATTRLMTRPLRALLQRHPLPPDVTLAIDVDAMNLG